MKVLNPSPSLYPGFSALTFRPWIRSWWQPYDNCKTVQTHKSHLCSCAVYTKRVCSWDCSEDRENNVSATTENWAQLLKCIQNVFSTDKIHFGLYFFSFVIEESCSWTKKYDQRAWFPPGKKQKENQKVGLKNPQLYSFESILNLWLRTKGLHIIEVIMSFMSDKTKSVSVLFCKNGVVSTLFKFQFG